MRTATLLLSLTPLASASWTKIAGYFPGSSVVAHNGMDLDQQSIQAFLNYPTNPDFVAAYDVYSKGGHSKSYAELTVPALASALSKGMKVTFTDQSSNIQYGSVYSDAASGATTFKMAYPTSDVQATFNGCMVGGLLPSTQVPWTNSITKPVSQGAQTTTGCIDITQQITVRTVVGPPETNLQMTASAVMNKNGRTIQGFSTGAEAKMYNGCPGCPYHDYLMYYDYYGSFTYADMFVSSALYTPPSATGFGNPRGDMTFVGAQDVTRVECSQKGTMMLNTYMYVIREYEDAIDDCNAGCSAGISDTNCNKYSMSAVHAWDEGVAFYVGSLEGEDGSGSGVLGYYLADKRCQNFKTCTNDDGLTGPSKVNEQMFVALAMGQHSLLMGKCEATRPYVYEIVALMGVPLVQGTLRYAYKVDVLNQAGAKEKAEGAVFAAAIVPRVFYCNAADGQTIMDNMKLGAASTNFATVKAAFERNYKCMNITCADVGGLWFGAANGGAGAYYAGAEPCGTSPTPPPPPAPPPVPTVVDNSMPDYAIVLIALFSALFGVFFLGCVYVVMQEKAGKPIFLAQGPAKA